MLHFLKQKLSSFFSKMKSSCKHAFEFAYVFTTAFLSNMHDHLRPWHPWFQWVGSTISGIITFISTLETTLKFTPVLLSALTVLTALPLFHLLLPSSFIFEPIIFTPILLIIAGIAGYRAYNGSIERDRLDRKIEDDGLEIIQLNNRISTLENSLISLAEHQQSLLQQQPISFRTRNRQRRATPQAEANEISAQTTPHNRLNLQ